MSGAEHVQDQELPHTLSILPLKNRILLPSSAMKLLLTSPRSVALVDAILSSTSARGGNHNSLYVGVVPLRRDPRANSNAFAAAAGMLDDEAQVISDQIGRMPEARMLLMAGLMLADKTAAVEDRIRELEAQLADRSAELEALKSAPPPDPDRVEVPVIPASVT